METYQVFITVYTNKPARISINGSHRNTISYDGGITDLPKEKEAI